MKAILTAVILTLSVFSTPAWPAESDLRLELETALRTLRLGQDTTLKMRIAGAGISRLTAESEGIVADSSQAGAFVLEFKVKPPREGKFTFGPYRLSFNGQDLTSDRVSIQVLPPWSGTYGTFFRVDSNNITLGESIELVVETWSDKLQRRNPLLKTGDEAFSLGPGLHTSSTTVKQDVSVRWERSRWLITPKKPGEFRITKDSFRSFPENVHPPDLTITVEEAAPPADSTRPK